MLVALPFVLTGGVIGLRVFARLETAASNRVVLWVLAASGLVLFLRA